MAPRRRLGSNNPLKKLVHWVLGSPNCSIIIRIRTRPELRFRSGPIPVPVPVDLTGTRPVPRFFSCWIKVKKTTIENGYILKSENLEMLFLRFLNFKY